LLAAEQGNQSIDEVRRDSNYCQYIRNTHMTLNPYTSHEVTASPQDIVLLRQFYRDIYVPEFPDPNERESVENMERYLQLKAEGWYGRNNYHILLYLDQGIPVAGSISDYLEKPNAGVIEFLVIKSPFRQRRLGAALLQWTEDMLHRDSLHAGYSGWDYVVAEMNDPFKLVELADSMDPFQRSMIWHRWGYKKISFPYIQPALSPDKEPVRNLLLVCKTRASSITSTISSNILRDIVSEYARWAMRIDNPDDNEECREMTRYLEKSRDIGLVSLAEYIGDASVLRLTFADLTSEHPDELDAVLDVYANELSDGPTSVPRDLFKQALMSYVPEGNPFDYHLLSIKTANTAPPKGMASFFTFPGAGFGGYIVFDPAVRGKGYLSEVITHVERHMVMDKKGARGWYCECDPAGSTATIFRKRNFYEVDIIYRQPPLYGQPHYAVEAAPVLHLMYKEFGENFEPPRIPTTEFLDALNWIYRVVYQIDDPEASEYHQHVRRQMAGEEFIRWR
jgi:GNAT superfamily N-acetyltransferase